MFFSLTLATAKFFFYAQSCNAHPSSEKPTNNVVCTGHPGHCYEGTRMSTITGLQCQKVSPDPACA